VHPALADTAHRPWPPPSRPWRWRQTWHDLLFAHWPLPAAALRPLVPPALTIQEFDGSSWVGLVPFRMTGVTLRGAPAIPGVSAFAEMNLRLYVELNGKAGVWFVSLDAAQRLAVWTARALLGLPYFHASMRVEHDGEAVRYSSERRGGGPRVAFAGTYRPIGPVTPVRPGTLDHFLTERYCLYTIRPGGALARLEIHHQPWPLQPAEARIDTNLVAAPQGIQLPAAAPRLHFSRRIEVVGWGADAT
jgi:hypothetical protein